LRVYALTTRRLAGWDEGLSPARPFRNEILPDCFRQRYISEFLLKRLPYQRDGVRVADDETAAYLESWVLRDYTALGYKLVRVPVLPPKDRLDFVLESLSDRGLI
jgi:hypothetical protein